MNTQKKININEYYSSFKDLQISNKISFDDDVWDFYNEDNVMLFHIDATKARIPWKDFHGLLPEQMIYEVKQLALIYLRRKDLMAYRFKEFNKGFKDHYTCTCTVKFLKFLSLIYQRSVVTYNNSMKLSASGITSIFDLTLDDLRFGIEKFSETGIPSIKAFLKNLSLPEVHELINQNIPQPKVIRWNAKDILNLRRVEVSGIIIEKKERYLESDVVSFLVSRSTQIVNSFCQDFGLTDVTSVAENNKLMQVFHDVRSIRMTRKTTHRIRFKTNYGMTVGAFVNRLCKVQYASLYLIFQLTGARYSEAVHFKRSDLEKLETGFWIIRGKVIKNRASESITDNDYWIVTDITFKAILALEVINIVYGNNYLLSSSVRTKPKRINKPVRLTTVNTRLKLFFRTQDTSGQYHDIKSGKVIDNKYCISTHKIRHTLVREMIKCRLNLAQLSYHFKHVYVGHMFMARTSNVTLGYGGIKNIVFNDAFTVNKIRGEFVSSFINANSPIAGNMGSPIKNKTVDFYNGRIISGVDHEGAIDQILKAGVAINDIGIGFCVGVHKVTDLNGTEKLPSCISKRQCDSILCSNSFFIKEKLPNLKAMLRTYENTLLNNELSHFHPIAENFVSKLRTIISELETPSNE